MNADTAIEITPKAMIVRWVDEPTPRMASTRSAKRRSRPWTLIALAITKPPMKRKIVPEANAPNTASSSATPSSTHSATPTMPATGIGIASVIQKTIVRENTAASVCCSCSRPSGRISSSAKTSGPRTRPTAWRLRSKACSRSESTAVGFSAATDTHGCLPESIDS